MNLARISLNSLEFLWNLIILWKCLMISSITFWILKLWELSGSPDSLGLIKMGLKENLQNLESLYRIINISCEVYKENSWFQLECWQFYQNQDYVFRSVGILRILSICRETLRNVESHFGLLKIFWKWKESLWQALKSIQNIENLFLKSLPNFANFNQFRKILLKFESLFEIPTVSKKFQDFKITRFFLKFLELRESLRKLRGSWEC